jgi:hypothetical protein
MGTLVKLLRFCLHDCNEKLMQSMLVCDNSSMAVKMQSVLNYCRRISKVCSRNHLLICFFHFEALNSYMSKCMCLYTESNEHRSHIKEEWCIA